MPPLSLPVLQSGKPSVWEEAIYAFLVEKRGRSGSTRTVESYARMLWPFFRVTTPDQVRPADVLAYAHGIGASGRVPSSTTVGARIACLSSFYRFAIRMGLLTGNPCDALERPRGVPALARGYSASEVRRLLAVVPDTMRVTFAPDFGSVSRIGPGLRSTFLPRLSRATPDTTAISRAAIAIRSSIAGAPSIAALVKRSWPLSTARR